MLKKDVAKEIEFWENELRKRLTVGGTVSCIWEQKTVAFFRAKIKSLEEVYSSLSK